MSLVSTDSQYYQDIAQAIADVKGESVSLTPAQMAAEVANFYYVPTTASASTSQSETS